MKNLEIWFHEIFFQNEEHLQDLEDYEAFARTIGRKVYNTTHVDIIQLALNEPEESAVYKAALQITSERPQRLFFEWKNRKAARSPHSATILHNGAVRKLTILNFFLQNLELFYDLSIFDTL